MSYTTVFTQAAKNSWKGKTENLNLDKDGSKLWSLARATYDENPSVALIVVNENDKLLTGKKAADHHIKGFEAVGNLNVPEDRQKDYLYQQEHVMNENTEEEVMVKTFIVKELEEGLHQLQKKNHRQDLKA